MTEAPRLCLTDLPLDAFEGFAQECGAPRFAGRNLRRWIYQKRATSLGQMTDLSKGFRRELERRVRVRKVEVSSRRQDESGTTAFVLRLDDGALIESVLIPEDDRRTVCISTQVGCPVACVFCASGLRGLTRNLTPGEIVEQTLIVQDHLPAGEALTNIVVMGIGEPTLNLPALRQALETWNDRKGMGIGARRITISTVGYPRRIDELAALDMEFGLAVSLHAPFQELRDRLIPGSGAVRIEDLIRAARRYFEKSGRRITFEYVLLDGINASLVEAEALARLLKGVPCNVNLLPYNPVDGLPFVRPAPEVVESFRKLLLSRGIDVTRRKTRGEGIAAACGQLRLREGADDGINGKPGLKR